MELLTGNELFYLDGESISLSMHNFWQFKYSNIHFLKESIAEYLIAKILGFDKPHNSNWWTLYDIKYRDFRIEVKETSYYHPWNMNGKVSKQRSFGITKANSSYEDFDSENKHERQNDIYVFCLNTGNTAEESNPLNLNNWTLYIVPTSVINMKCENQKTVSLGRVRRFGCLPKRYDEIKSEVDRIIDEQLTQSNQ